MNLAARLKELEDFQQVTQFCKIHKIMNEMDEETKTALERILKTKVSNATIAKELSNHGFDVGRTTLGLHRTGRCSCKATQ